MRDLADLELDHSSGGSGLTLPYLSTLQRIEEIVCPPCFPVRTDDAAN